MQGEKVAQDLARGIGRVVKAKTYSRVVASKRTLAYELPGSGLALMHNRKT
jgi:hypothetical protein